MGVFSNLAKQLIKKLIFRRAWNFRVASASVISSDSQEAAETRRPPPSRPMRTETIEQTFRIDGGDDRHPRRIVFDFPAL
jgi:hypothetical protein